MLFVHKFFLAVSALFIVNFFFKQLDLLLPLSLPLILRSSFKCLCKPRLPPQGLCFMAFFLYSLQVSFFVD